MISREIVLLRTLFSFVALVKAPRSSVGPSTYESRLHHDLYPSTHNTPSTADAMETLESLVQALPPEIYNQILDFTFTAAPGIRYINYNHRPSSCLHVSRSTRRVFAQTYYGCGAVFAIINNTTTARWIETTSRAGWLAMIKEVRVLNEPLPCIDSLQNASPQAARYLIDSIYARTIEKLVGRLSPDLSLENFSIRVKRRSSSFEWRWMSMAQMRAFVNGSRH